VQPSSRAPVAFSPTADIGLTDLDLANGMDYDDVFDDERAYDVEYEVSSNYGPVLYFYFN